MPSSRGCRSSYDCIIKIKGVTTRPILFSQLMRSDGEGAMNPEELFADDRSPASEQERVHEDELHSLMRSILDWAISFLSEPSQGTIRAIYFEGKTVKRHSEEELRPHNRGRRGLLQGPCGHRLLPGRERIPVVFRDPSTRVYREGATFGNILALYEFDVELREIMLDALLKVEVKIRSAVAYEFCAAYGESQSKYLDVRCYAASKGREARSPEAAEHA